MVTVQWRVTAPEPAVTSPLPVAVIEMPGVTEGCAVTARNRASARQSARARRHMAPGAGITGGAEGDDCPDLQPPACIQVTRCDADFAL